MKPGTLVKWKVNNIAIVGRIVSNGGDMAQVQANGSTYEVTASELRVVRACAYCGREITSVRRDRTTKYCSPKCAHAARVKRPKLFCKLCGKLNNKGGKWYCSHECQAADHMLQTEQLVFGAIIEYKQTHDGLSPSHPMIAKMAYCNRVTVQRVLNRLADAGKIRYDGIGTYRGIVVVGGKWMYEESQP